MVTLVSLMNKEFGDLLRGDKVLMVFTRPKGTRSCHYDNMVDGEEYTILDIEIEYGTDKTIEIRVLDGKNIARWFHEDELFNKKQLREWKLKQLLQQ